MLGTERGRLEWAGPRDPVPPEGRLAVPRRERDGRSSQLREWGRGQREGWLPREGRAEGTVVLGAGGTGGKWQDLEGVGPESGRGIKYSPKMTREESGLCSQSQ